MQYNVCIVNPVLLGGMPPSPFFRDKSRVRIMIFNSNQLDFDEQLLKIWRFLS